MRKVIIVVVILALVALMWFVKTSGGESVGTGEKVLPETNTLDLEALKQEGLPIIIDFGSDTCPPCVAMLPDLKSVYKDTEGKAIIRVIDVNDSRELAMNFPIQVTPTQVFYDSKGNPYMPSEEISASIEFLMYGHKDTEDLMFTIHQGTLSAKQLKDILVDMGGDI